MNDYLHFLATFGIGGAHPGGITLTKKILQSERINHTTTILDAGCGTGQTATYLKSKYNCHVVGIDNHPLMVEKAKNRLKPLGIDVDIKKENIEKLSIRDSSFDLILCESVISFTDIKKTLSECLRVLKSDGILLAIEMTSEGNLKEDEKRELQRFYGVSKVQTEDDWKKHFLDAGFKEVTAQKAIAFVNEDTPIEGHGTEFLLSSQIDPKYYDVFDQHEWLISHFKEKLGYRIYRCIKST